MHQNWEELCKLNDERFFISSSWKSLFEQPSQELYFQCSDAPKSCEKCTDGPPRAVKLVLKGHSGFYDLIYCCKSIVWAEPFSVKQTASFEQHAS